jgi:hypothetical protein
MDFAPRILSSILVTDHRQCNERIEISWNRFSFITQIPPYNDVKIARNQIEQYCHSD